MTGRKKRARVTKTFPRPIHKPELLGLRLKKGTTIAVEILKGESQRFFVNVRFSRHGNLRTITFSQPIVSGQLPELALSNLALERISPATGEGNDAVSMTIVMRERELERNLSFAALADFLEPEDDEPDTEVDANSEEE